ncbi:hypothetical protein FD723_40415 (plasmid) [Nostoc sp. C052]|uniref:hypothetical protein n=1 Tax=Nostoc sp. C052 TaxID=2576902 RepID=UPI0015C34B09|nr:hypothetical protein [Nostoc sp. C052]QLE46478.1 hypothetical protein FD723_40415 [Nostoc sp. C052]
MQGKLWACKDNDLTQILNIGNREDCRLLCESLNTYVGGTVDAEGGYDSIRNQLASINFFKFLRS